MYTISKKKNNDDKTKYYNSVESSANFDSASLSV